MINVTSIECINSSTTREPYRTITLTLLRIYPTLFLIVGTAGNLLSVYVVLRSKLRGHSTFIYLAFLSVVDLIVLYTFSINFILHAWFNIDIQHVSLIACKIYSFSIYFFPQTSAWILTAVSIDRVLALTGRIRKAKKTRSTYFILALIFLILFLLNVQFLFYKNSHQLTDDMNNPNIYRIVDTDMDINVIYCSSENLDEYKYFYQNIWVYVDAIVNVYLPFTLMFLCSAVIFLSVLKTMGNANNSNKRLVARSLSTMLLSINVMFVLLTGPIVIYLTMEKQTLPSESYLCDMKVRAKYKMIKLICIILMNANHTGNILVYCLTGTEFRKQLCYVLRRNKNLLELNSLRPQLETSLPTSMRNQSYITTPRSRMKQISESLDNDEDHLMYRRLSPDERKYFSTKYKQPLMTHNV